MTWPRCGVAAAGASAVTELQPALARRKECSSQPSQQQERMKCSSVRRKAARGCGFRTDDTQGNQDDHSFPHTVKSQSDT